MTDIARQGESRESLIWGAAIALAALGAWIMYDALPGINWGLWTATAALGMLLFLRTPISRAIALPATAAIVIAFGAAVTADEFISVLIVLSVIVLLAFEMLLSPDPRIRRITAGFFLSAPIVAFASAIMEAVKRAAYSLHLMRSDRARSVL